MRNFLLKSAMSIAMAATATSFAPAASAQDIELEIGRDGPRMRLVEPCDPYYEDCRYGSRDRDRVYRERWREEVRYARRCTEDRALDKAERMGLRRVGIISSGRRVIEVRGRERSGERVIVAFGRAPNCPIL